MKDRIRFFAMLAALFCLMSAFGVFACADGLQSGKEMFADVSEEEAEALSDYEKLMYRAYQFDEELLLPTEENVAETADGEIRFVQGKYGMMRGQELYDCPDDAAEVRWFVRDSCRVLVHGESEGFYFVELLYYGEPEGTFAWIPAQYVVDEWSIPLSVTRTDTYRAW